MHYKKDSSKTILFYIKKTFALTMRQNKIRMLIEKTNDLHVQILKIFTLSKQKKIY